MSTRRLPWLYLLLAYGLAWLFWIPVALTGQDYQASPVLLAVTLVGVFGPGAAGIILTYAEEGKEGGRDFWRRAYDFRRIRPYWYGLILLLWPALSLLAAGLSRWLGAPLPPPSLLRELVAQPLTIPIVLVLYLIQAGLEELGWRGYMLDRVQPAWGPVWGSLIVGIFHALWHLPLFFVAGTNQIKMGLRLDFLLFVACATSSSFYETWSYNGNDRSTLAATLLHWTGNLTIDALLGGAGTVGFRLYSALIIVGALVISAVWVRRDGACVPAKATASPV